ncbi:MAG: hypothetical protein IPK79_04735 [Vampirovibrionales bacterium]|nr:hypothetical protein [Vampirovibrionales bacterium]
MKSHPLPAESVADTGKKSLIADIVLPSAITLLILFCLAQVGLSYWSPGAGGFASQQDNAEQYAAISAFAN